MYVNIKFKDAVIIRRPSVTRLARFTGDATVMEPEDCLPLTVPYSWMTTNKSSTL